MVVVLVIYNVFAMAERNKRDTVGAADTQSTGLYAQFVLAREIANGGNGISAAMNDLFSCTNADLRPIPVLITDGGLVPMSSDSIQVTYSTASRVNWPVFFVGSSTSALYPAMVAATDPFFVQSPNGFQPGDRLIVIGNHTSAPGTGTCQLTTVTSTPGGADVNGVVRINHPATAVYDPSVAKVLNLGPAADATQQTLFDVAGGQLRSTNRLSGAVANPIAQNVVLMKAQYGVDCLNNGVIQWTSATNTNLCGDPLAGPGTKAAVVYDSASVQAFDKWALRRIRAIRVGIVVRSDEPELKNDNLKFGNRPAMVLFDCSAHTDVGCPGRIAVPNSVLTDYYRFRTYETVIPLRNAIWNWDPLIT
jgi:type IV pilus assembly protein PilW